MHYHTHSTIITKSLRSLAILILGLPLLGSVLGFVAADCRPDTEGSTDRTLCTSIIGGAGDNTLTIEADTVVTGAVFGDGIIGGKAGNDTIINNGVTVASSDTTGTNGDIEGDVIALGNGGDDVLVNNGTVGGDMDGDTALNGDGGNDTIINSGVVDDDIDGDNASGDGGDDLMINNGTVGGDIQGDDNNDEQGSTGGNDLIVIAGTVEGKVDGDAGVQTGGDDVVILQTGANGGGDNTLYIYGQGGNDTLVFNFMVADQATIDTLSEQIANANPLRGSLEYNGQTFTWEGFEQVQESLGVAGMTKLLTTSETALGLLHRSFNNSFAIYCKNGDMIFMGSSAAGRSEFLYRVTADQVATALEQAAKNTVVIIASSNGQTLTARPNLGLQLTDAGGRYQFSFWGNACSV
ncbi:MAG: hypothetical protein LCI00_28015 [Chloroflexi bacterium]|nr:hypothetical protein [Chloroflexota bacterium]MCC6893907.1 hypothetical protein [Anaerolineae bacterium]